MIIGHRTNFAHFQYIPMHTASTRIALCCLSSDHGASAAEKIGTLTQLNFCILTVGLVLAFRQPVSGKVLPCPVTKRILPLSVTGQTLSCEPGSTTLTLDSAKYSGCPNHTCAYLRASQSLPACHTWRSRGDRVILQQHQHQRHGK